MKFLQCDGFYASKCSATHFCGIDLKYQQTIFDINIVKVADSSDPPIETDRLANDNLSNAFTMTGVGQTSDLI